MAESIKKIDEVIPGSTITCAYGRKIRLPKVFQPLHKSAMKDLHSDGLNKMSKMDIANVRKRAERRQQRQQEIERKLYNRIKGSASTLSSELALMKKDDDPHISDLMKRMSFHDSVPRELNAMLSSEGSFTPFIAHEMDRVWDKQPYEFQNDSIDAILRMNLPCQHADRLQPGALTAVQQTSRGKSAITRCARSILRGVVVTIVPLLSIGADQVSKIDAQVSEINELGQRTGSIVAFHLDEIKKVKTKKSVANALLQLKEDTSTTVFLFVSPQAVLSREWQPVMERLTERKLVRLFCLDEVHLYVSFGLTFRHDFVKLKEVLFKWIRYHSLKDGSNSVLKVPVLLMTATWDLELARIFELMTGVHPKQELFIWASAKDMKRRQLSIKMQAAQKKGLKIKAHCRELLDGTPDWKGIIYSNSRRAAWNIAASINEWLDREDLAGDTVEIDGELFPEQKFFYTRLFTDVQAGTGGDPYRPRLLIATAGSAGAGLDCPEVHLVVRDGLPVSVLDLLQELGIAGRRDGASPDTDKFVIMVSLNDYLYLLRRIYDEKEEDTGTIGKKENKKLLPDREVRQLQVNRLNKLVSILCLKRECLHLELERLNSNPLLQEFDNDTPCENACPQCTGDFNRIFPQVRKAGVIKFLVDKVVRNSQGDRTAMELVDLLINYKDVGQMVYTRPRSIKSHDSTTVGLTVLQWIAAGIIDAYVKKNAEGKNEVYVRAGCNDDATFHFNDDSHWERIETK